MDFSIWQIAIVLVIALIVFGPKRLPELGSSLGRGMREFKDSITRQATMTTRRPSRRSSRSQAAQPQPEPAPSPSRAKS